MVLFFYGPNSFAARVKIRETIERFKKKAGSDFGLERFDGDDPTLTADKLITAMTSVPFLAEHRLIIIEDLLTNKPIAEVAVKALRRVPKSTVVIWHERKPDERTRLFKMLVKASKPVKFQELGPAQLNGWVRKTAQDMGGKIDQLATNFLIQRVGNDQWRLWHELQKLASFKPTITKDMIEELTEASFEDTIFNLIDALVDGRSQQALELYQGLRSKRAEPLYILNMIAWGLRNLIVVKAAGDRSAAEMAKDHGMSPFVVGKATRAVRDLDLRLLKKIHRQIVATDFRLKTTSADPDILLEQLLFTTSQRLQKVRSPT
ncbi:DNA polymerase III subunit delta [Candidatus Microgenomates bacterium]|nr:DNA polymerase III subunit delta [Candidatus Microgenomates bacterium]